MKPAQRWGVGSHRRLDARAAGVHSHVSHHAPSHTAQASLLGAGLLTLPFAYQQLGWLPAALVLYGVSFIAVRSTA